MLGTVTLSVLALVAAVLGDGPGLHAKVSLTPEDMNGDSDGKVYERSAPAVTAELSSNIGDVDIVYTWYNVWDPHTQEMRKHIFNNYYRNDPNVAADAGVAKRFVDSGELKFSLRSVERYAPWVRRIHIVIGDGQPTPAWLNVYHSKIRIVRHSTIFPSSHVLPTFNSLAIEACLHRIPDLANHFIYFNDDMFLGDYVSKETFFSKWDGRPLVWLTYGQEYAGDVQEWDDGHTAAEKNTHRLVERHAPAMSFYDPKAVHTSMYHFMKSLTKDVLAFAEHLEPQAFAEVRSRQFRSRTSISPITFASMICVQNAECENAKLPSSYFVNIQDKDVDSVFHTLHNGHFAVVCINNSDYSVQNAVRRGYESLFPYKSSFEK